jgi:hypothetical protein
MICWHDTIEVKIDIKYDTSGAPQFWKSEPWGSHGEQRGQAPCPIGSILARYLNCISRSDMYIKTATQFQILVLTNLSDVCHRKVNLPVPVIRELSSAVAYAKCTWIEMWSNASLLALPRLTYRCG